jgi:hypothetical protein
MNGRGRFASILPCAKNSEVLMLFDLRVLLAACLATLIFAVAGLGLLAGLRSPFKSSTGYTAKDAPVFSGPGLPRSKQLPVAEASKPEVTGTIQTHMMQTPAVPVPAVEAAPKVLKEAKPVSQPKAKSPSIATLIEDDEETKTKPAVKPAPAKKAAKPKKKPHHARRAPPPRSNPFSIFTNNNNSTATQ